MALIETLVRFRRFRWAKELLAIYCIEIPKGVKIGQGVQFRHRAFGTVIHPSTEICDEVIIYHGVTIGRADAHLHFSLSDMQSIRIEEKAVLFPGCVILGKTGRLTVGRGTIVAANAVLTRSTGEWEIWGGVPAKLIGMRKM